ncbi:MAG: hypothetical protein HQK54_11295 [Oligoflexales bacterium]|nr:hypothetical protein [Oligoflexales bacterium]
MKNQIFLSISLFSSIGPPCRGTDLELFSDPRYETVGNAAGSAKIFTVENSQADKLSEIIIIAEKHRRFPETVGFADSQILVIKAGVIECTSDPSAYSIGNVSQPNESYPYAPAHCTLSFNDESIALSDENSAMLNRILLESGKGSTLQASDSNIKTMRLVYRDIRCERGVATSLAWTCSMRQENVSF